MYEVWEVSAYPAGQVLLSSAGKAWRKVGLSGDDRRYVGRIEEEFRTASLPAAANLNTALNWLHEQGRRVISFVPAGGGFPPGTFWIVTVPLNADAEHIASVLEAKRGEDELNQARNKALRPGSPG